MNILRVYTDEANREKVEKATAKILGKIPQRQNLFLKLRTLFLKY